MHGSARGRLGLAAAAVATVGHAIGYLAAVPDLQVQAAVLAQTGHDYWSMAVAAASVFGVLAAVTVDRVQPLKKQRAGLLVAAGQWRTRGGTTNSSPGSKDDAIVV
jgi:exo-beta-1,3-glucanase (GH17 family)